MNSDQAKPGPSGQSRKKYGCLPNFYERRYSNMNRLPQAKTPDTNRTSHETIQPLPSTSAYSGSPKNKLAETLNEDITLNCRPTLPSPVKIVRWWEDQQTHIKETVHSKTSELLEHTYAQSSQEEHNSKKRFKRLMADSNLENIRPLSQNDSNTSLLKESSCPVAADSSLRLSEDNGSFPGTSKNNTTIEPSSDADLLINFANSAFEDYYEQTNPTQHDNGMYNISLHEDDKEESKVLSGQQEPYNHLLQTASTSSTSCEPLEVPQVLSEGRPTPGTEMTHLENFQPSTSCGTSETRPSNNYDVRRTTKDLRNLINIIVQPLALSPLKYIFEAARISTAEVEDSEQLLHFYNLLLEELITAQTQNNIQPSCGQVLEEEEDNQNTNENDSKTKEMATSKIVSDIKIKSWKNVIIERYVNNDNLSLDTVPLSEVQTQTETPGITGRNVQSRTNESIMSLSPQNTVSYHKDSDSIVSSECDVRTETKKLSSTVTKRSISINTKKMDFTGEVGGEKLFLESQGERSERCRDKSLPKTSSVKTENITTSSKAWEKVSNINQNAICPTNNIDGTSSLEKNCVPMGEERNLRPNVLSALMNFKKDYFIFRRQVMLDFIMQAHIEKKSKTQFKANKVAKRSIKVKSCVEIESNFKITMDKSANVSSNQCEAEDKTTTQTDDFKVTESTDSQDSKVADSPDAQLADSQADEATDSKDTETVVPQDAQESYQDESYQFSINRYSLRIRTDFRESPKNFPQIPKNSGRFPKKSGRFTKKSGRFSKKSGRIPKKSRPLPKKSERILKNSKQILKNSRCISKYSLRDCKNT